MGLTEKSEEEMKKIGIIFAAIAISIVMSVSGEAAEKRLALIIGNAD